MGQIEKAANQTPAKSQSNKDIIKRDLKACIPQFALALPKGMDANRFFRILLTFTNSTPGLWDCSRQSLMGSFLLAAQLGLDPSLGQCAIVPYKGKATFQIGYKGFIQLVHNKGEVKYISADVVYEFDKFVQQKGTDPKLEHIPFNGPEHGPCIGAYAVAFFRGGGFKFEYMRIDELNYIQASSKSEAWIKYPDEMRKKSAIKRLSKTLPISIDDMRAVMQDEVIKEVDINDITTAMSKEEVPDMLLDQPNQNVERGAEVNEAGTD